MDRNIIEQIRLIIKKAEDKLHSAKVLFDDALYDDATSRSYYAAFHAAQAVLLSEGLEADTHTGLKTVFGLNFVKKGKIEPEYGRMLSNLKDDREEGDYEAMSYIDEKVAKNALEEAKKFVARMKEYLAPCLKKS